MYRAYTRQRIEIMIREMTRGDLPSAKQIIDSTSLFPSELLDDMAADALNGQNKSERWLVIEDKEPVGIAYLAPERMTEGTWNLYLIAIHADRQGRGVGSRLVAHIEAALASEGHRILLVETSGNPEFQATRQFYLKNGYIQEACIREFYAPDEDKIVFWKRLEEKISPALAVDRLTP